MDVKQIAQMMGMPVDQAKEQLEQMLAVMMQNQHRSTLKKRESRTEDDVEFMKTKYTEERMEQEEKQTMMKSVFDTVEDMIKAEADKGEKTAETVLQDLYEDLTGIKDVKMESGKHRGLTFEQIAQEHRDYAKWILTNKKKLLYEQAPSILHYLRSKFIIVRLGKNRGVQIVPRGEWEKNEAMKKLPEKIVDKTTTDTSTLNTWCQTKEKALQDAEKSLVNLVNMEIYYNKRIDEAEDLTEVGKLLATQQTTMLAVRNTQEIIKKLLEDMQTGSMDYQ